ncbi:MAG TPA: MotA/TolQ/ExbB proton channel family protein [Elusimicrobiota bacterium]|nr:MotA/TolQ/ExbB proton channel family protein [Elusimicrobiota bacterium]
MGNQAGLKDILVAGGPILIGMLILSVYCVALIWERWKFFSRATNGYKDFLSRVRAAAAAGKLQDAAAMAKSHKGLSSSVVLATLTGPTHREERQRAAERAIGRAVAELETGMGTLGTIASVAPFIGLFGTVVGVMRAFHDLAAAAGAGPGLVAVGISEALVTTAAGLLVAIPAVAAFNHFNTRIARFHEELGWTVEEVLDGLSERAVR